MSSVQTVSNRTSLTARTSDARGTGEPAPAHHDAHLRLAKATLSGGTTRHESAGMKLLRLAGVATGVFIMAWAAMNVAGCGGAPKGKYTQEAKNAAQLRIDTLKAATEYQMASQALAGGDLEKALRHCDRAITLNDKVARTWVLRGRIMLERNDLQASADAFSRAEQVDPTFVETFYFKGILAERVGERANALEHYRKAAELDADNAQYALATAEMMIDAGDLDGAESYLNSRLDRFRHTAGFHQALGHIQSLRSNYTAAEEHFTRARILAPDQAEIIEDLARVQFLNGRWADSEKNLARVLKDEKFKDRRDLMHMRAQALTELNRLPEARDLYLTLTRDDRGSADAEAWIGLGRVAITLRDTNRLRQAFANTIAIAPQRPEGYILKGLHLRRQGDFRGAAAEFQKATERNGGAEAFIMLGMMQIRLEQPNAAQRSFSRAAEAEPANPLAARLAQEPQLAATLEQ